MHETRETHLLSYHQVTFDDTLIFGLCHTEFVRCGASIKSPRLETKKKFTRLDLATGLVKFCNYSALITLKVSRQFVCDRLILCEKEKSPSIHILEEKRFFDWPVVIEHRQSLHAT